MAAGSHGLEKFSKAFPSRLASCKQWVFPLALSRVAGLGLEYAIRAPAPGMGHGFCFIFRTG